MKGVSVLSKERLDNSVLNNAISTYKTVVEVAGDIIDEDYSPVLDKVTLAFLEELKQYRDLEEQGLLLRLPCKVGDTVWEIVYECEEDYTECLVSCNTCHIRRLGIEETRFAIDMIDDVGNCFFLTQSEAEEKLRELEGK